ncbi:P-loop containing nucleoside triphosphate hydrolase protein [Lyophyllum atratum]|nr:P-loop containing nucleoside triphosphate hydrolase protein [Lyophyllum atratum]
MAADQRSIRLNRHLDTVLKGKSNLVTAQQCKQFIEAICIQPHPANCIERVFVSPQGLPAVQAAIRNDLTDKALNGQAVDLLTYMQDPAIKTISRGQILTRVLNAIVEASSFWTTFIAAFKERRLEEAGQKCFAWTLHNLLLIPTESVSPYLDLAKEVEPLLLSSPYLSVRTLGQHIKHTISVSSSSTSTTVDQDEITAGGRHDNDFAEFREVAILPTTDELASTEAPFLRPSAALDDPRTEETRESMYLDNQFRLLREDMIHQMREELQIAQGRQQGKQHRGLVVEGLQIEDCDLGDSCRRSKWSLIMQCKDEFPEFRKLGLAKRKEYLKDKPRFFKHQSLTSLIVDDEVVAFPSIRRVEELLVKNKPQIVLELQGEVAIQKLLLRMKSAKQVKLIQIDVAVFAYEPILNALKSMKVLPLSAELLFWKEGSVPSHVELPPKLNDVVDRMRSQRGTDVGRLLGLNKKIILDPAQERSLLSGLMQKLSIIQGPPGTGKSFIGALLAKFIHDFSDLKILVVCYTNHALDQFLEDLLGVGIDSNSMVRIGGKSTSRTEPMLLRRQQTDFQFSRGDHAIVNELKSEIETRASSLTSGFKRYLQSSIGNADLMSYLEFEEEEFYTAFELPTSEDQMVSVGKGGRVADEHYLLDSWRKGGGPGIFSMASNVLDARQIWSMTKDARQALVDRWIENIRKEQVEELYQTAALYNKAVGEKDRKFKEKDGYILKSKRIIGCTTTAAAMHTQSIHEAAPDVVLVEEAGEILESHVVTALGRGAKQLILIGDHKQLRPKVNYYNLTVEKGEGYNLNMSLFERLVLKGYPHETLTSQHRMRPEISSIIRHLTYPDLTDAAKTKGRPDLRGLQDNVIFINHNHPEDELRNLSDMKDMGSKSSKQNMYEARMVLKIVKYLAQQGYGTEEMVVLTPYLGQLTKLQHELKEETDPVLNDLDSYDLIRAGLLTPGAAKTSKRKLRLATIDNYQGEESDIVIASLTRSNSSHDIGFMNAPERLNVLLSRARNGLILIGNSDTFTKSKKGGALWQKFFAHIKDHVYDGFPVVCDKHPQRKALLSSELQFEQICPNGGCTEPCGTILACGLHKCPLKCHQLSDHSKTRCEEITTLQCPKGHDKSKKCFEPYQPGCTKCDREAKIADDKRQKEFARQRKREEEEADHLRRKKDIDERLAEEQQIRRDDQLREERENEIRQKMADLEEARLMNQRLAPPSNTNIASSSGSDVSPLPPTAGTLFASDLQLDTSASLQPKSDVSNAGQADTPSSQGTAATSPPPQQPASEQASTSPKTAAQTSPPKQPASRARSTPTVKVPRNAKRTGIATSGTPAVPTPSVAEWQRRKSIEGMVNPSVDAVMSMTGLEEVKSQVMRILDKIEVATRQGAAFNKDRYNVVLLGNPGTGKTTVARHYAKFLASVNVLPGMAFEETTGSRLASDGVNGAKALVEKVINAGGGAIFVDEAYQLASQHNFQGSQVLDFLLAEMENNVGKVVYILAGYNKQMESFFEHNPGLSSRVPHRFQFNDYGDDELCQMLERLLSVVWAEVVVAMALETLEHWRTCSLSSPIATQARVAKERRSGSRPDDLLLLREDLIGPDPSTAILESDSWRKLQKLIGLPSVKRSIQDLHDMIMRNYNRELKEQEPMSVSLNRTFIGSPGTGKTTVAELYGRILADLGLLMVAKNPADFVGSALGESENKTKAILANTIGKVLIIDEARTLAHSLFPQAYMLYGGGATGQQNDPYKTAVIDTLVAEVQSTLGEDRCVLLLGYEKEMKEMFQNVNPGLSRRFAIEDAFKFEDFTYDELLEILNLKLGQQNLDATPEAKRVALDVLERAKIRPNFGNGGEVENVISKAKANYMTRNRGSSDLGDIVFQPVDFDPSFDRAQHAGDKLVELFKDVVGCDEIVTKLRSIQKTALSTKRRGHDVGDLVPTTFVFKGPPGTGKTTTARKMGEVYFDMGLLARPTVHECSASDIVAQYVGQTGPLVRKTFEKALGQILFIDEAYRLKEGLFAKEATDEIVSLLTDERYKGKIVVILAGYDDDINQLLAVNRGLSSRFTEEVLFVNLRPEECLQILEKDMAQKNIQLPGLADRSSPVSRALSRIFIEFSTLKSWGNARDVKTLAKKFIGLAMQDDDGTAGKDSSLILDPARAMQVAQNMLSAKIGSQSNTTPQSFDLRDPLFAPPTPLTSYSPVTKTAIKTSTVEAPRQNKGPESAQDARDDGVSDAVWSELQRAKEAAALEEKRVQEELAEVQRAARAAAEREKDREKQEELKRQREAQRLKEIAARQERERLEAALKARREAEDKAKKQEAKVQAKLRQMGVCVAGFRWQNMGSGYRCAGGSHYIDNAQLGI